MWASPSILRLVCASLPMVGKSCFRAAHDALDGFQGSGISFRDLVDSLSADVFDSQQHAAGSARHLVRRSPSDGVGRRGRIGGVQESFGIIAKAQDALAAEHGIPRR